MTEPANSLSIPLREIAATISSQLIKAADAIDLVEATTDVVVGNPSIASKVKTIIAARRERTKFFPEDMFSEPFWDLLLALMSARLNGTVETSTSLAYGTGIPLSTCLRHLVAMEQRGFVTSWDDPNDRRRKCIGLTNHGAKLMLEYLALPVAVAAI